MPFSRIYFIVNPISGTASKSSLPSLIKKHLDAAGINWLMAYTDYPAHATELAAKAISAGADCVVAVGGDGTINEVAQSLIHQPATLGIIPSGSGNGLARHLGIPLSMEKAIKTLVAGHTRPIDTGIINGKHFFCTSGVGFDATVSHRFAQLPHRGLPNYVRASWQEYFQYQPQTYQLSIDGKSYEKDAFMVTIANAAQFGNNAYISPNADISDGLFDVCIVKPFPKMAGIKLIWQSFAGRIHQNSYLEIIRGKDVRISQPSPLLHIDGDPLSMDSPLHYQMQHQSLQVCC